jgi:hypothetical protein
MSEKEKIEKYSEDDRPPTTDDGGKSIEGKSLLSEENKGMSEEKIELSTPNIQPDNETMEVHKHPHHVTHKKKWGEYLLEFFMLFLAVFLGFVAENIREHKVEIERENEFIYSLANDIKKDIGQGDSLQIKNKLSVQSCDSLLILLSGKEIITNSYPAYFLWSSVNGFTDFVPNDGTIQQLKNSGALRLIRKKNVVDKLMEYEKCTELIRLHQSAMNSVLFQDIKKSDLFDILHLANSNKSVKLPLLGIDKKILSWGYSYIKDWKNLLLRLNKYVENAKTKGNDLLQSINNEYHLENE